MSILSNGTTLQNGKYTIVNMLGQGGFGITYLASTRMSLNGQLGNMNVDVYVTIKEFFISMMNTRSADGRSIDRTDSTLVKDYKRKFIREAINLSHLQHDNIVKVLEVFEENNTAYYVMEYIDGGTVDEFIIQNGKLSATQTVDITGQVCSALAYMHNNRILHLDLKPKNIMLTKEGKVKLIDFGLAKQYNVNGEPEESTTLGLGTPGYAPIEQATYRQDGSLPVTLDIYALGATMYKMLTGVVPPESSVVANEGLPLQPLRNVGVPNLLIDIVSKAMAPLRRDRIQSVQELNGLLARIRHMLSSESTVFTPIGNDPYTPRPISTVYGPPPPNFLMGDDDEQRNAKKRKIIVWSSVGGVLLIAGILCAILLGNGKSHHTSLVDDDDDDDDDIELVEPSDYVSVDNPEYSEELLEYAKDGNADAQYDLAVCYINGNGVEEDEYEAARWFRKAANQGHAEAQNMLGNCLYFGNGVEEDKEEAVKWFKKAAAQDNASAQFNLGFCYEEGEGVEADGEEAVVWYRKAAEQGDPDGQTKLGKCYLLGIGMEEEDNYEAVRWFRKAVDQGNSEAQFYLGCCYEYGWGVEQDIDQAKEWLQRAADQGDTDAQNELENLEE